MTIDGGRCVLISQKAQDHPLRRTLEKNVPAVTKNAKEAAAQLAGAIRSQGVRMGARKKLILDAFALNSLKRPVYVKSPYELSDYHSSALNQGRVVGMTADARMDDAGESSGCRLGVARMWRGCRTDNLGIIGWMRTLSFNSSLGSGDLW